jgi:pectate lyase
MQSKQMRLRLALLFFTFNFMRSFLFFITRVLMLCFAVQFSIFNSVAQLPSFPNAQGWGSTATGGRGGIVIEVTNLNDAGPGSFREACSTTGVRTIVFRTGGIIELQSEIQLTEPYVTIAAQTAPGGGIELKNYSFSIFTHNVIIRGLRIRPGDENIHNGADVRDCVTIQAGSHHVIIDHCSLSWGIDENLSVGDSAEYVTVQWCIISEGLYRSIHPKGSHSMGLLVGAADKTSVHHNLLAHNNGRNPVIKGGVNQEFLCNVIYDWGYNSEFYEGGSPLKVDISGNYWKPRTSIVDTSEMPLQIDFDSTTTLGSRLYCKNNMYVGITFLNVAQIQNIGGNAIIFSDTSVMDSASSVSIDLPLVAYDTVLAWAGALHPQRDSTDIRVLTGVRDSTGGLVDCMFSNPILLDSGEVMYGTDSSIVYSQLFTNPAISPEGRKIVIVSGTGAGQVRYGINVNVIDSVLRIVEAVLDIPWTTIPDSTSHYQVIVTCDNAVGGWGIYAAGTPPADTDHDGMPDAWETEHGLNPIDSADRNGNDLDSTGYTNLEVYLNEFYNPNSVNAVEDLHGEEEISFYPNPAHDKILFAGSMKPLNVRIYDLVGTVVKEANTSHRLSVQDLAQGLYILEMISHSGEIVRKKFIKE